jgi:hypothetical protein
MENVDPEIAKLMPAVYLLGVIVLGSLGTLVGVVVLFLKDRRADAELREKVDIRSERRDKTFIDSISVIGASCHAHQKQVEEDNHNIFRKIEKSLDQNTQALSTNTEVLRDVRQIMRDRETREND